MVVMVISKKQQKKDLKELIKFCENPFNNCYMYNYMMTIKSLRAEGKEDK